MACSRSHVAAPPHGRASVVYRVRDVRRSSPRAARWSLNLPGCRLRVCHNAMGESGLPPGTGPPGTRFLPSSSSSRSTSCFSSCCLAETRAIQQALPDHRPIARTTNPARTLSVEKAFLCRWIRLRRRGNRCCGPNSHAGVGSRSQPGYLSRGGTRSRRTSQRLTRRLRAARAKVGEAPLSPASSRNPWLRERRGSCVQRRSRNPAVTHEASAGTVPRRSPAGGDGGHDRTVPLTALMRWVGCRWISLLLPIMSSRSLSRLPLGLDSLMAPQERDDQQALRSSGPCLLPLSMVRRSTDTRRPTLAMVGRRDPRSSSKTRRSRSS